MTPHFWVRLYLSGWTILSKRGKGERYVKEFCYIQMTQIGVINKCWSGFGDPSKLLLELSNFQTVRWKKKCVITIFCTPKTIDILILREDKIVFWGINKHARLSARGITIYENNRNMLSKGKVTHSFGIKTYFTNVFLTAQLRSNEYSSYGLIINY
jgi:hypothetical protein